MNPLEIRPQNQGGGEGAPFLHGAATPGAAGGGEWALSLTVLCGVIRRQAFLYEAGRSAEETNTSHLCHN